MADWTENPPSNPGWRTVAPEENQWQTPGEQQAQRPWTTHEHGGAAVTQQEMAAIASAEAAAAAALLSEQRAEADRAEVAATFSTFTGQYNAFVSSYNTFTGSVGALNARLDGFDTRLASTETTVSTVAAEWAAFDAPDDGKVYGRLSNSWTLISVAGSTAASLVPFTPGAVLASTNVQSAIEEAAPPDLTWAKTLTALRAMRNVTGGGTISVTNNCVKWSNRFLWGMGDNKGPTVRISAAGNNNLNYVHAYMPALGTQIPIEGAGTFATVTADGIPLSGWQALYYNLAGGLANADNDGANFRIVQYNNPGGLVPWTVPSSWALICLHNGDSDTYWFPNGITVKNTESYDAATTLAGKFAGKANSVHTHTKANITDFAHTHLWADITDKPTTFTPATHTHAYSSLTGIPTTFAPSAHTHPWADVTGKPATFPPDTHTHAYSSLTGIPTTFAPSAHTHPWTDVTGKPATYPPDAHVHAAATTAADGFMSAADKTKLNGVDTGANNYVHPTSDGNRHVPATTATDISSVIGTVGIKKYLRASTNETWSPVWDEISAGNIADAGTTGIALMKAADIAAAHTALGNKRIHDIWTVANNTDFVHSLTAYTAITSEYTYTPKTATSNLMVMFWLNYNIQDNADNTTEQRYHMTAMIQYLTSAGAWAGFGGAQANSANGIAGFGTGTDKIFYGGGMIKNGILGQNVLNPTGQWQIRGVALLPSTFMTLTVTRGEFVFIEFEP